MRFVSFPGFNSTESRQWSGDLALVEYYDSEVAKAERSLAVFAAEAVSLGRQAVSEQQRVAEVAEAASPAIGLAAVTAADQAPSTEHLNAADRARQLVNAAANQDIEKHLSREFFDQQPRNREDYELTA